MSLATPIVRRRAAAAGGLVLALSLVSAPAAVAQDDPTQALTDLMAAIEAKDFSNLAGFFCAEHAAQAGDFDIAGLAAGMPGVDPSAILDAIIMDTEIATLEVVSQSDTEAVVKIEGSISTGLNAENLGPFVEAILAATGEEVTPEMVETMTTMLTSDMEPTVITIAEEVTVTPAEGGGWVVCDQLSGGTSSDPGPSIDPFGAPSTAPMASPEVSG